MNSPYIITFSGKAFNLIEPQREQIVIEDIAHALARENRFNGHTKAAYSVAQHCYHASFCVPPEF
ncbi:HD family hydrolase, partial [Hafnia paralvei]